MSRLPRLEKATPVLTARERVLLVLQARRAGREPEIDITHFDDPRERRLYDRYVGLIYVANAELGLVLQMIARQAQWLAGERQVFEVLREAAEEAAAQQGQPVDWKRARSIHRSKVPVGVVAYLANLSEQARELEAEAVVLRWKELRALEQVWEGLAAEFEGIDLVDPQLRELADKTRATLKRMAERCGLKKMPEPEAALTDQIWGLVDHIYETMKLVKEEP
jgi:hypothetical protein